MITVRYSIGFVLAAMVLSACGKGGAASPEPGGQGNSSSGNISGSASHGVGESGNPRLMTPVPGLRDVHPIRWNQATGGSDDKSLIVTFWLEPCYGIDHVRLTEKADRVIVTLYAGSPPSANQPCIQLAEYRAVKVTLSAALGIRKVVDGAPVAGRDPSGGAPM